MAFTGIFGFCLVAEFLGLGQESCGAGIEKDRKKIEIVPVETFPELVKSCFVNVSKYHSAANTAENIAVRVDVNAFGIAESFLAVQGRDGFYGFIGEVVSQCECCSACESEWEFFIAEFELFDNVF